MYRTFLLPTGLLAGTIIGAGIFAIPYVFSKAGVGLGFFYLALGGVAYTLVHLMYADVIMRTRGDHRFPGYAGLYLGRPGFLLAFWIGVMEMVLVMTIYLILSQSFGKLLAPGLGGMNEVFLFWVLGSLAIFASLERMTVLETVIAVGILLIILTIFGLGIVNIENVSRINWQPNWSLLFLPLAPVLFSLSGRVAIPALVKYTTSFKNGRMLAAVRRAIVWGTSVPVIVYALFAIGILGLSSAVTEDAITGLVGAAPQWLLVAIGILGLFTLWSSYIIVGYDVNSILTRDFKLGQSVRLLTVVVAPLALFIFGLRSFLVLVSFAGGIFLALEGLLIIAMWFRANNVLKSSSLLMRGISPILIWITVLVFLAALGYQVFS